MVAALPASSRLHDIRQLRSGQGYTNTIAYTIVYCICTVVVCWLSEDRSEIIYHVEDCQDTL